MAGSRRVTQRAWVSLSCSHLLSMSSLRSWRRAWASLSCSIRFLSGSSRARRRAAVFCSCSWGLHTASRRVIRRVSASRARLVSWVVSTSRCRSSCYSSLFFIFRLFAWDATWDEDTRLNNLWHWYTSISIAMEAWRQPTQLKKHTKSLGKKRNLGDSIRDLLHPKHSRYQLDNPSNTFCVFWVYSCVFRALLWKNNNLWKLVRTNLL